MANKRDIVKARRRLKKPKKIYTNTPLDRGFGSSKNNRFGLKIGHEGAKAVYMDNGRIKVNRLPGEQLSIPLQKSNSPIESFNHGGLQKGNSPQKIQAVIKKMDSYLISNRISPQIRQQILHSGERYKSAAGGFYRAKDPERKNFHREIIREFELNAHRLGLRGIEIRNGVKTGYINNNVPKDIQQANYEYYEAGYNKMLDKANEKYKQLIENGTIPQQDQDSNNIDSPLIPQEDMDWIMTNDIGDGVEYGFYTPDEVAGVIRDMKGGKNAQSHYQNDLVRICNSAGYTVNSLYNHLELGADLPAPNSQLLGEDVELGSKGAQMDVGEIKVNSNKARRK